MKKMFIVGLCLHTTLALASEIMAFRYYNSGSLRINLVNSSGESLLNEDADDITRYTLIEDKAVLLDRFGTLRLISDKGVILVERNNVSEFNLTHNGLALRSSGGIAEVISLKENLKTVMKSTNASSVRTSDEFAVIREPWKNDITFRSLSLDGNEFPEVLPNGRSMNWRNAELSISDNFVMMKDEWGYTTVFKPSGEIIINLNNQIVDAKISDEFFSTTDIYGFTQIFSKDSDYPIYSGFEIKVLSLNNTVALYEWADAYYFINLNGETEFNSKDRIKDYKMLDKTLAMRTQTNSLQVYHEGELAGSINNVYADYGVANHVVWHRSGPAEISIYDPRDDNRHSFNIFDAESFMVSDEIFAYKQKTANVLIVKNHYGKELADSIMVSDFNLPIYIPQYKWLKF